MSSEEDKDKLPPKRKLTSGTERTGKRSQASSRAARKRYAKLFSEAYRDLSESSMDLNGLLAQAEQLRVARTERGTGTLVLSGSGMSKFKADQEKTTIAIQESLLSLAKRLKEVEEVKDTKAEQEEKEEEAENEMAAEIRAQIAAQTSLITKLQTVMRGVLTQIQDGAILYDPRGSEDSDEERQERVQERMRQWEEQLSALTQRLAQLELDLEAAERMAERDDDESTIGGIGGQL